MGDFWIYYANGTKYNGPLELASKWGVIAIVQHNPNEEGWHVIQRKDFYLYRPHWSNFDFFQAADQWGFMFYMLEPGTKFVLFGETVPEQQYATITENALAKMRELNSQ